MIRQLSCLVVALVSVVGASRAVWAECLYARAGWTAELTTVFHNVSGTATIIDERTIHLEDFTYDGGGPAVYAYLGAADTHDAFLNGLAVPPLLTGQVFNGESLTLTLPPGETLDGYTAISIWCADVNISFGSGSFEPPAGPAYPRAGWTTELSTIFHSVAGTVSIINERILHVEHFTYDGGGPAVYFYLGATNSNADFIAGLRVQPLLSGQPFADASLVLTLPPGQTLDGYGAVSVWCADVRVNFGSGSFGQVQVPGDADGDCRVDIHDYADLGDCMAGVDALPDPSGPIDVATCLGAFDFDADDDVDLRDLAAFQGVFTNAEGG